MHHHACSSLATRIPAADDRVRQQPLALGRFGCHVGQLEARDDAIAQPRSVFERLQRQRVLGDAGDAEGRGHAPESEHEVLVAERLAYAGDAVRDLDDARIKIDRDHLAEDELRATQLRAHRRDDVPRFESAGAHLGQHRREERKVLATDHSELGLIGA